MKSSILVTFAATIGVALSAKTLTDVQFEGKGFKDLSFNAHLHNAPCSNNDGGGHYDGGGTANANDVNENWPLVTCDHKGKCKGAAWNYWAPAAADLATTGLSIVVHNTPNTGEKMLCADLVQNAAGEYSGSFDYLDSFDQMNDGYGHIKKDSASLTTLGLDVAISFRLDGNIADGQTFKAHLHAASCSSNAGGGHYKGGDGMTTDAINENWPKATCDHHGKCTGFASSDWQPTEAEFAVGLSVVVHDTITNDKMHCADLMETSVAGVYSGQFAKLVNQPSNNWGAVSDGSATASKTVTTTMISFRDTDFGDNTFKSHLHADTCANSGGVHYNGGDGVTGDAVEENWPAVTCDAGVCSGMAVSDWLIPDSDFESGLSLVVHDTPSGSGSKMLCSDLASNDKCGTHKGDKLDFLTGSWPYGYPSAPKHAKTELTTSHVSIMGGTGGKGNKGKNGKKGGNCKKGGNGKGKGKTGSLMVLSESPGGIAVGASAGLLVVAAAVVTLRRRNAKTTGYDPLQGTEGESQAIVV